MQAQSIYIYDTQRVPTPAKTNWNPKTKYPSRIMIRHRTLGVISGSFRSLLLLINSRRFPTTSSSGAVVVAGSIPGRQTCCYSIPQQLLQPPPVARPSSRTFSSSSSSSNDPPDSSAQEEEEDEDDFEEEEEQVQEESNIQKRPLWGDGKDRGRPLRNDWGSNNNKTTTTDGKPKIVGGWKTNEVDLLKSSGALWAAQQEVARDIVLFNTLKKKKDDEPDPPTNIQNPKLFVYNLHRDMDSHYFREMFERKARIPVVMAELNFHPGGASQCTGIVEFQSIADAELAVQRLFGKMHMNRKVYMREYLDHHHDPQRKSQHYQQDSARKMTTTTPGYWVRVENLHPDTNWKLLKDIMTKSVGGNVLLVQIGENPHTGETFGRVKYETQEDADKAIQTYQDALSSSQPLAIFGKPIEISHETHPHVPILRPKQPMNRSPSASFGSGRDTRRNKRADWSNW
jgi:hypothetical protein